MRLGGLDLNGADHGLLALGVEAEPEDAIRPRLDILKYPDVGDQGSPGVGDNVKTVDQKLAVEQDVEHPAILAAAGLQAWTVDRLDKIQLEFIGPGFQGNVVAGKADPPILIEDGVRCARNKLAERRVMLPATLEVTVRQPGVAVMVDVFAVVAGDDPNGVVRRGGQGQGSQVGSWFGLAARHISEGQNGADDCPY